MDPLVYYCHCPGWRHHRLGRALEPQAGGNPHHPHLNCQQVSRDVEDEGDNNDCNQNWKWWKSADHYKIANATHTTYAARIMWERTHIARRPRHDYLNYIRVNLDKNLSLAKTSLTVKQNEVLDQLWEKYFRSPSLVEPHGGYFVCFDWLMISWTSRFDFCLLQVHDQCALGEHGSCQLLEANGRSRKPAENWLGLNKMHVHKCFPQVCQMQKQPMERINKRCRMI